MRVRLTKQQRVTAILETAVTLANRHGLAQCDFLSVSKVMPIPTTPRGIRWHFRTKTDLWKAIASHDQASAAVKDHARVMGVR